MQFKSMQDQEFLQGLQLHKARAAAKGSGAAAGAHLEG
jgi:hypothetical protein